MFHGLQPTAVWAHFATLCRIPRPSKHEGPLRDHLRDWAEARGLATTVDPAGNLIVRKAAAPGRERAPGMVLQGHLDMVCQKNSDSTHDFLRDPIKPVLHDGWMTAPDTTLGADNGIGVALILAVLEDPGLVHGPIEALFTVDEEAGMGGAQGLAPGVLQGRALLNLDTEEWGEFYLGCAGGVNVDVTRSAAAAPLPLPTTHEARKITLKGLRGGHSGVNIHEGRGNAIKLLVRVLNDLAGRHPVHLCELHGGTARNALPREAFATVAWPRGGDETLAAELASWQTLLRQEFAAVEPNLALVAEPARATHALSAAEQGVWLRSLHAAPHGVRRMSLAVPGVVETSNNLGMVAVTPEAGSCNFMVRSLRDSGSRDLADEIISLWGLSGTAAEANGQYPGWTPNPASALLATCQRVYRDEFQAESSVQVIHAGLECGIIAAQYPGMDIVSFGPTIRGAHAPGESVDVASVTRTWQLLVAILATHAA